MVFLFFSHFAFIEISRGEHRLEGGGMKTEKADILDIYQERPVRLTSGPGPRQGASQGEGWWQDDNVHCECSVYPVNGGTNWQLLSGHELNWVISVQFCGQTTGTKGEFHEKTSREYNDENGSPRKGFHEGQGHGNCLLGFYFMGRVNWYVMEWSRGVALIYLCAIFYAFALQIL